MITSAGPSALARRTLTRYPALRSESATRPWPARRTCDEAVDDRVGGRGLIRSDQLGRLTLLPLDRGAIADLDVGECAGLVVHDDLGVARDLDRRRVSVLQLQRDRVGGDGLDDAVNRGTLVLLLGQRRACRAERDGSCDGGHEENQEFLHEGAPFEGLDAPMFGPAD